MARKSRPKRQTGKRIRTQSIPTMHLNLMITLMKQKERFRTFNKEPGVCAGFFVLLMLEVLYLPFVFFCGFKGFKCPQVLSLMCFWVDLTGVDPVLSRF